MKRLLLIMTVTAVMCFASCGTLPENDPVPADAPGDPISGTDEAVAYEPEDPENTEENMETETIKLKLSVNGTELTLTLADTAAAGELAEKLKTGPVTVTLNEYGGFEKVGKLPWTLTRNDGSVVTEPGDIMLYQGDQMTIFYNPNSWSYTKLGHIDEMSGEELEKLFGEGSITVTLSY